MRSVKILSLLIILNITCCLSSQAQYCAPTFLAGCNASKTNTIAIGSYFNWTAPSNCALWDYTSTVVPMGSGVPTSFTVTNINQTACVVWVDLNNNNSFSDPGEQLYAIQLNQSNATYNFTITIPASISLGQYRMRIMSHFGGSAALNGPCGSYFSGDYHDFTINVTRSLSFNNNGAFIIPAQIANLKIEAWGGGGGGAAVGSWRPGSGGGGGAYSSVNFNNIAQGQIINFTIGNGASFGWYANKNGLDGGNTTVSIPGAAPLVANGGKGGVAGQNGVVSPGGLGGANTTGASGSAGQNGSANFCISANCVGGSGGDGGSTPSASIQGGTGGNGGQNAANGGNGSAPGGGGGGGDWGYSSAGGKGHVIISWSPCGSAPTVSTPLDQNYCLGDTALPLTVTAVGDGVLSYQWYYNTINSNSLSGAIVLPNATSSFFIPDLNSIGTRYYFCRVTSSCNQSFTFSNTAAVLVNPLPVITTSASPSDSICYGKTVALSGQGASSYAWSGGISNSIPFVPSSTSSYNVVGTDSNGCSSSIVKNITVNHIPNNISLFMDTSQLCAGNVALMASGPYSTFNWSGGIANGIQFSPPQAQSYTVYASDSAGCASTDSIFVPLSPLVSQTTVDDFESSTLSPIWSLGNGQSVAIGTSGAAVGNNYLQLSNTAGNGRLITNFPATQISSCSWHLRATAINPNGFMHLTDQAGNLLTRAYFSSNVFRVENGGPLFTHPAVANTWYKITLDNINWVNKTFDILIDDVLRSSQVPFQSSAVNAISRISLAAGSSKTVDFDLITYRVNQQTVLSQATNNNALSLVGEDSVTITQPMNATLKYFDTNCGLILDISSNANQLGQTSAKVHVENGVPTHNGQPFVSRWYEITPTNNVSADVTFYFTQNDFDNYNLIATASSWPLLPTGPLDTTGINNVRVTKNDNAGLGSNPVLLMPTSVVWDAQENHWKVAVTTPSFSQFRIHGANAGNAALPIALGSFTVEKQQTSDLAKWVTTSESNNRHFHLQRSSNSIDFETLGKVNSKGVNGNSSHELNYSFVDEKPLMGHNYYRLEQVDIDGNKSYSEIIDIIWTDRGTVSLYPNPTRDNLNIDFSSNKVSQTEIKLMDMSGRVVKTMVSKSQKGMNHLEMSLSELANGVYHIQLLENNKAMYQGKINKK